MDHSEAVAATPDARRLRSDTGASHGRMMDPESWEKAKALITGALKRTPSEREVFVRQHCPDEALRAEIDALLKQYEEAADFLEEPPRIDESAAPDDLQPGSHVGPYIIVDQLGRGGMGQVFLGTDPRLHRKVALKCLISTALGGDDRRPLILNEARAAARINHPNVAIVHDVLEHESRVFMVMEYVEGESLAARLKRERLTFDRVVAIGRQLAAALAAAHAAGIVHRDLKPANIQVTLDGSVKVLDFGVAGALAMISTASPSATTTAQRSRRGAQVGTPGYMSPEQILGVLVDDRSDVFSLGIVLYEMTTGRRLYPSEDAAALVQMLAGSPPRADADDPRVPPLLADVIAKALAIDAADRFQSAAEVGMALETVEQDLAAKDVPASEPKTRWMARAAIGFAVTTIALGFTGFIATTGFNNTFGRDGDFARFGVEPWWAYFSWGLQVAFPSVVVMIFVAIVVLAGRFVLRILELMGPIHRALDRLRDRLREVALAVDLDNPLVLAQALTGIAILMLIALWWIYADIIHAWSSLFNSAPIEQILPMGPTRFARLYYKVTLDVMTLTFGFGLFKVIQLRKRGGVRDGKLAIGIQACVVAIFILMNGWSYRTLSRRDFERVELAGQQCYITGQSDSEFLVLCPASDPPRNRTVRQGDPTLHRTGIIENVFSGLNAAKSDR